MRREAYGRISRLLEGGVCWRLRAREPSSIALVCGDAGKPNFPLSYRYKFTLQDNELEKESKRLLEVSVEESWLVEYDCRLYHTRILIMIMMVMMTFPFPVGCRVFMVRSSSKNWNI